MVFKTIGCALVFKFEVFFHWYSINIAPLYEDKGYWLASGKNFLATLRQ
jgi:hypothetical protein